MTRRAEDLEVASVTEESVDENVPRLETGGWVNHWFNMIDLYIS